VRRSSSLSYSDGPTRADARRNRERLIHAAVAAFTEHGPSASLDGIAQAAGVGSGTLYRHFPTRDELIRAAYGEMVDAACSRGRALLAGLPVSADADGEGDSDEGAVDDLRMWLRELVILSARSGPAGGLVAGASEWPRGFVEQVHTDLTDIGEQLVGLAAPQLREGLTIDDLHVLVGGIATVAAAAGESTTGAGSTTGRGSTTERLLDLVFDGARRRSVPSSRARHRSSGGSRSSDTEPGGPPPGAPPPTLTDP
jgi:AcrR family transcriptional regulator